jgi:hypothetical protein
MEAMTPPFIQWVNPKALENWMVGRGVDLKIINKA